VESQGREKSAKRPKEGRRERECHKTAAVWMHGIFQGGVPDQRGTKQIVQDRKRRGGVSGRGDGLGHLPIITG